MGRCGRVTTGSLSSGRLLRCLFEKSRNVEIDKRAGVSAFVGFLALGAHSPTYDAGSALCRLHTPGHEGREDGRSSRPRLARVGARKVEQFWGVHRVHGCWGTGNSCRNLGRLG